MNIIKYMLGYFKQEEQEVTKSTYIQDQLGINFLADNFTMGDNTNKPVASNSILYRCIQLINDNISEAPLNFKYRNNNEDLIYSHPIVQLFDTPDGENPYADFIARSAMYYSLYGESFWFFIPDSIDDNIRRPRLINLHPKYLTERLDNNNRVAYWDYNPDNTTPKPNDSGSVNIPAEFIIQIKNGNPYNFNRGLSIIDALEKKININHRALEFQSNFLKNGAALNLVITQSPELAGTNPSDLKKVVKAFDQRHAGPSKAGKTGILTAGLDVKTVGIEHDKMQFLEVLKYTEDEIITAMGLHKTILGKTENINMAISKDQREMLWQYTLKPMTTKFASVINYKLLRKIDPSIEAYYDYSTVMPEQRLTVKDIPILRDLGFTRNEINRKLKLNFDEDETGDIRFVKRMLVPIDDVINPPEEETNTTDKELKKKSKTNGIINKSISNKKRRNQKRFLKIQGSLERQFKSKIKKYAIGQRSKVLSELYNPLKEMLNADSINNNLSNIVFGDDENLRLQNMIKPIMEKTIQAGGEMALDFINVNRDYVLNAGILQDKVNKIVGINQTTYNNIKMNVIEGIDAGETIDQIANRIKSVYSDINKSRGTMIARTETSSLISEASHAEYVANGISKKIWITAEDEAVRPEHEDNGNQGPIPINQPFQNGEHFPGENSINCRCVLAPWLEGDE